MPFRHPIANDRQVLRRIVVRLLALGDVAEAAASRSRIVCFLALWFLVPCEAFIREWLEDLAPGVIDPPAPVEIRPDVPDLPLCAAEALRLAWSFRMLAAALALFMAGCSAESRARPARELSAWRAAPVIAPCCASPSTGQGRVRATSPPCRLVGFPASRETIAVLPSRTRKPRVPALRRVPIPARRLASPVDATASQNRLALTFR